MLVILLNITNLLFGLASFRGLNTISDQYLHRPAKVDSQSQKSRIHMK